MKPASDKSDNGWLGGSDETIEDTWTWSDGETFSFTNWNTGAGAGGTAENCLQMRQKDGLWDDVDCMGTKRAYICKK